MKAFIILPVFLLASFCVRAQAKINPADLEVSDSSGMVYPTIAWQKLVSTGKYGLKVTPGGKTGLLYVLSEEEIARKMSRMSKPPESQFFKTGGQIASFSERDINGNKYNLKDLAAAGKVVILNFWFIGCPPCRNEIPELNELVESYKDNKDVVFIAVALDQKYEIKDFLKTNPYHYNIIDNGRYIADKYGIHLYPTHAVINREGKVVFHTSGLARNTVSWIKKSIDAALNNTLAQ